MSRDERSDIDGQRVPIDELVQGERGVASVGRSSSFQARASSVLAGGITMILGVAALTWYYANALTRPSRAREAAQATAAHRSQAEMPLPPLGRVDPPVPPPASSPPPTAESAAVTVTAPALSVAAFPADGAVLNPSPRSASDPPGSREKHAVRAPGMRSASTLNVAGPPVVDRRLSGTVFARQSEAAAPTGTGRSVPDEPPHDEPGTLAQLLRPTATTAVQAKILPTRRFLLPKGSFIDCTLETAIDSTLPGMTTCIAAMDTFSADGSVVLLERGTQLVGETRGEVRQGAARVFVLWTEARTPTGVVVPLDSPGTDELGRSGLEGSIDRHFWERFGAAILISAVDGAVQAAVQSSGGSGGTVIYNPTASEQVLTEVLKGTISIPPTVRKNQGDRIQVFVARDVDFRSVYDLRQ